MLFRCNDWAVGGGNMLFFYVTIEQWGICFSRNDWAVRKHAFHVTIWKWRNMLICFPCNDWAVGPYAFFHVMIGQWAIWHIREKSLLICLRLAFRPSPPIPPSRSIIPRTTYKICCGRWVQLVDGFLCWMLLRGERRKFYIRAFGCY